MKERVAFLGAGSHADAILPILDPLRYQFIGFFDDKPISEHDGYPILGRLDEAVTAIEEGRIDKVFITIGENKKRQEIFESVAENHYDALFNIISPQAAVLTPESICGRGIFVGYGAFIGSKVHLGDNTVVNTNAIVEHHTVIDGHCNIAPNATVNGLCHLAEDVYVGSSATLVQLMDVVSAVTIGAGATVVRSITESGTYVGLPARKIK